MNFYTLSHLSVKVYLFLMEIKDCFSGDGRKTSYKKQENLFFFFPFMPVSLLNNTSFSFIHQA